jgi:2-methylisocitrate lyase-like PEP mutase family enzyme
MLAEMGFPALATSSAAIGRVSGRGDYEITRKVSLQAARELAEGVDVPVSADLENGFGDDPAVVAETVRLAGEMGLAGCSIEDAKAGEVLYDFDLAVERIVAAVEANQALDAPLVLTARVEHHAQPHGDLDDTIRRLQAFEAAGADVLFAPGVNNLESLRLLCAAVAKPVSVIGPLTEGPLSVNQLAALGVKRISTAASLHTVGTAGLRAAAGEIRDQGTFAYAS